MREKERAGQKQKQTKQKERLLPNQLSCFVGLGFRVEGGEGLGHQLLKESVRLGRTSQNVTDPTIR